MFINSQKMKKSMKQGCMKPNTSHQNLENQVDCLAMARAAPIIHATVRKMRTPVMMASCMCSMR